MSSLWTPGGERPVPPREPAAPSAPVPPSAPGQEAPPVDDAELESRLAELRDQLTNTPVEGIVAQVAYQLFEVAALHLSLQPPRLEQAQLAIDAMAALVDALGARLGEHLSPLRDGLSQIRMAFVQIKGETAAAGASPPTGPADPEPPQS